MPGYRQFSQERGSHVRPRSRSFFNRGYTNQRSFHSSNFFTDEIQYSAYPNLIQFPRVHFTGRHEVLQFDFTTANYRHQFSRGGKRWFRRKKESGEKISKPGPKKYDEFDDDDTYSDDMDLGATVNHINIRDEAVDLGQFDEFIRAKYESDKVRIKEFLQATVGDNEDLDTIKRIRFLLAAVQTFGNLDDLCMPTEFAMCEFNLHHGIIDQYSSIVGPWKIDNKVLQMRASWHSMETHKIPFNVKEIDGKCLIVSDKELMKEILGRAELEIAYEQGVAVGLYKNGLKEFDDDWDFFAADDSEVVKPRNSSTRKPIFA